MFVVYALLSYLPSQQKNNSKKQKVGGRDYPNFC